MKNEEYVPVIEAALFAAGFPVKFERLEEVLGLSHDDLLELLRSKAFIEQVRGVDSSYAVTTLGEKQLIEVTGRLDVPGKPNLYGTTDTFLRCFGLGSLDELPKSEVLDAVTSRAEETETEPETSFRAMQGLSNPTGLRCLR